MTDFRELHAHSYFSFLDGASSPEDLVAQAARWEQGELALTDHGGLHGAVRFARACRESGMRPLHGAEIAVRIGSAEPHHLVLLVRDRRGWANLCRLLTLSGRPRSRAEREAGARGTATPRPGRPVPVPLTDADLERHAEGLFALTGCLDGVAAARLVAGDRAGALAATGRLVEVFGREAVRVEVWRHLDPREDRVRSALFDLADSLGLGVVATNVTHYARPEDRAVADVLACIRAHRTLDDAGTLLRPSDGWALPDGRRMAELFAERPDAIRETRAVAEQASFDLRELSFALPPCQLPEGETAYSYLHRLAQQGARERYRPMTPAAARQIAHELDVIERLELAGYFLLVWDIVRFCRENRILVQGRGSAANSAVCYCLGITAVDPVRLSLLFERFLSAERGQPPDIDLDIAHQDRERVIQYVYERYGREHAAMVAEVISYRARLAAREVGKVMGLSVAQVDRLAGLVSPHGGSGELERALREAGHDPAERRMRQLLEICARLEGVPRHVGIHVGGMIITANPLCELVPVQDATMPGRTIVQWDKDDVADLGMAKIDLLGLGMLSAIGRALALIADRGVEVDPAALTYDEPEVFDMLCAADTVGVFQLESRAQMVTLPRLRPRCFYDLVIEVALIRPGPIQGDMVHPYLRRRNGEEEVTYPHPCVEPVLARTLGVPLFQEQGMRLAVLAAGFSAGEADELRRAMGSKRSEAKMQALKARLTSGMLARGLAPGAAATIVGQLTAFANYGFPESHAASFALLVYLSAHLKRHFPVEYVCALLNSQPMGFYAPATLIADARRHGVEVLPVDLGVSDWDCTVEREGPEPDHAARLRLGLRLVKGLGPAAEARLARARAGGPFSSVEDLVARAGLPAPVLERLASIGCLGSFGLERRTAVWQLQSALARHAYAHPDPEAPSLLAASGDAPLPAPGADGPGEPLWPPLAADPVPLEPMAPLEQMAADYRTLGLSTTVHPMHFLRARVRERGALLAVEVVALGRRLPGRASVKRGPRVLVAGLVISRQSPPTAKGFMFLTLEDETGFANVIVRPDVPERFRTVAVRDPVLLVEGALSVEGGTVNVLAKRIEALALEDPKVRFRSRDFR